MSEKRCRNRQSGTRGDRGAAAVEFALVVPLLLLVVVGIIQFGRIFSMQIQLSGAANAGARYLAVNPAEIDTAVVRTKEAAPNLFDVENPAIVEARVEPLCLSVTPGDARVYVEATRVFVFDIPLLPNPNITILGRGTMPCTG